MVPGKFFIKNLNQLCASLTTDELTELRLFYHKFPDIIAVSDSDNQIFYLDSKSEHSPNLSQLISEKGSIRALTSSVDHSQYSLTRFLLEQGGNPNLLDNHGDLALNLAVLHGNNKLVELLLNFGADCNLSDSEGNTPLIIAAQRGRLTIAKLLLAHQSEVGRSDLQGRTAINWAKIKNHSQMIKLLSSVKSEQ